MTQQLHDELIGIKHDELIGIKKALTKIIPHVKSSHRCEALARALGYRTYADALIETRKGHKRKWNPDAFTAYLREKGFHDVTTKHLLMAYLKHHNTPEQDIKTS